MYTYCGTVGTVYCGTVGTIYSGTVGTIYCGTMGTIYCGTVGTVYCGTVGTVTVVQWGQSVVVQCRLSINFAMTARETFHGPSSIPNCLGIFYTQPKEDGSHMHFVITQRTRHSVQYPHKTTRQNRMLTELTQGQTQDLCHVEH